MAHAKGKTALQEPSHSFQVQLGARGRLVLPAELRRRMKLQQGDRLVVTEEGRGVLRITSAREVARSLRGAARSWARGESVVDELIQERRREAARE